ncbi:hypothetical protein [Streptomyces sp. NPDC050287]
MAMPTLDLTSEQVIEVDGWQYFDAVAEPVTAAGTSGQEGRNAGRRG